MHVCPERLGCVLMEEAWGVWQGGREGSGYHKEEGAARLLYCCSCPCDPSIFQTGPGRRA